MSTRKRATQRSEPTEASLREAALRHLARYAATQARLVAVLDRRIDRWRRAAEADPAVEADPSAARRAARVVVAGLVAAGVVDDAAYAQVRARTLLRSGRSARAAAVHLAQRGIDAATVRAAVGTDGERELAAALMLARKRRLGPYAVVPVDAVRQRRALGALARAGFDQATARAALATPLDEAEMRVAALRRG